MGFNECNESPGRQASKQVRDETWLEVINRNSDDHQIDLACKEGRYHSVDTAFFCKVHSLGTQAWSSMDGFSFGIDFFLPIYIFFTRSFFGLTDSLLFFEYLPALFAKHVWLTDRFLFGID